METFYHCRELHERPTLDEFLSRALSVELKDGYLTLITKSNYVLTLDYATKMLNIHERCAYNHACFICATTFIEVVLISTIFSRACIYFQPTIHQLLTFGAHAKRRLQ